MKKTFVSASGGYCILAGRLLEMDICTSKLKLELKYYHILQKLFQNGGLLYFRYISADFSVSGQLRPNFKRKVILFTIPVLQIKMLISKLNKVHKKNTIKNNF